MNPETGMPSELRIQQLESQIIRMRADYSALQSIHNTTNAEMIDLQNEIVANESHIAQLLNRLNSMANTTEQVSFTKMVTTNYTFLKQLPLPTKIVLGSTIAYRIYKNVKGDENDKQTNSTPTMVIIKPDIEILAPPPVDITHYQKVVEVSTTTLPHIFKEIKFVNQSNWLPF